MSTPTTQLSALMEEQNIAKDDSEALLRVFLPLPLKAQEELLKTLTANTMLILRLVKMMSMKQAAFRSGNIEAWRKMIGEEEQILDTIEGVQT